MKTAKIITCICAVFSVACVSEGFGPELDASGTTEQGTVSQTDPFADFSEVPLEEPSGERTALEAAQAKRAAEEFYGDVEQPDSGQDLLAPGLKETASDVGAPGGSLEDPVEAALEASSMQAGQSQTRAKAASKGRETRASNTSKIPTGYYVQVAAVVSRDDAKARAAQLTEAAFAAVTQSALVNDVEYTRVLVGPYPSYGVARSQLERLEAGGFTEAPPFIKRVNK